LSVNNLDTREYKKPELLNVSLACEPDTQIKQSNHHWFIDAMNYLENLSESYFP